MFIKFRNSIVLSCFFAFISCLTCKAMDIHEENLFVPHGLDGKARLMYDYKQGDFTAIIDGESKKINKYNVSGIRQNISKEQMEGFLKVGYFSLKSSGDDYCLNANFRLLGGVYGAEKAGVSKETGAVVGTIIGGGAGAVVGAVVGGAVGTAIGGPAGTFVGGAVGTAVGLGGTALGNDQPPKTQQPKK